MYNLYKDYQNIWTCFNPSGKLNPMIKQVQKHLINYEYTIDINNNIFIGDFSKKRPCLVAHLDSVHNKRSKKVKYKKGIIKSENGIGGDDKCGIVAILEILSNNDNVNAIFTSDEEIGGIGASKIESQILENVLYFIEIDREGNKDIIYESGCNVIASDDFVKDLKPYAKKYGFEEDFGTFTDVNILTETAKKSAINISAGYYNAHTKKEYVNIYDLRNTIDFVETVIRNIKNEYIWEENQMWKETFEYNKSTMSRLEDIYIQAYNKGYDNDIIDLITQAYEIGYDESVTDNSINWESSQKIR